MSAFMVGDKTINRLVTFFGDLEHQDRSPGMYLKRESPFQFDPVDMQAKREQQQALGHRLKSLNAAGVRARYGDRADDMFSLNEEPYLFAYESSSCDFWQVLKSLDCLLYQCSEGDIPETDALYGQLDAFRNVMARVMASITDAYERAAWA